jgi:sorting nexin-8
MLHEYFLRVYEFRMIPRLPPKQLMLDAFLEDRRAGLQRWLTLISQNPTLAKDDNYKLFLVRNSTDFPPLTFSDDEFDVCSPALKLEKPNGVEEIIAKREQIRRVMNQLLVLKRLIALQTKRRNNQRKDYGELASTLCSISTATPDDNLNDFSLNFLEISKTTESPIESGVTERLELLGEVLIAFSDLCDRVIYQKQMSLYDDKTYKGFNGSRLKNMIRSNLTNYEEEVDRIELQKRRASFGLYCVIEELKLVQKYLKLLPSILLQFTYDESKTYSDISHILHNIIEIESDKLNS